MLSVSMALWLLASPPPVDQIHHQITAEYEHAGRTAPADDPALDAAARALASRALRLAASAAASPNAIADAVSDATGFDPGPRAIVVRASPPPAALEAFLHRPDVASDPANAVGSAWAEDGTHGAVVVLLAQRKVSLAPFPRHLPRARLTQALSGTFTAPLSRPELFLTGPDGKVAQRALRSDGARFGGDIPFPTEGRYTVEVIGTGAAGPEVAAIFHVDVGAVSPPTEADAPDDLTSNDPRGAILSRINALRARQQLAPLTEDDPLRGVAQQYAEQMAREHFFAHVDPAGHSLSNRLRAAGVTYQRAGENLGLAPSPLEAEDGIERSPGHRQNLLDGTFTRIGIGLAEEQLPGRTQRILVEVLATPRDPLNPRQTGDALMDALAQRRRLLHLPPLRRSAALDRIALERAQAALSADSVDTPPPRKVEPQVFGALPEARRAAVELSVTSDVRALPPSRALADAANDVVGFAAIPGNSRRYGADKFWVVVIYASTR